MTPLETLRYHVTGAIERGEAVAIVEQSTTRKGDTMSATPRPWKSILAAGNAIDIEGDGEVVCSITADSELEEVHEANAALIVQAVNTLDEAKAVIKRSIPWLAKAVADGLSNGCAMPQDLEMTLRQACELHAKLEGGAR